MPSATEGKAPQKVARIGAGAEVARPIASQEAGFYYFEPKSSRQIPALLLALARFTGEKWASKRLEPTQR